MIGNWKKMDSCPGGVWAGRTRAADLLHMEISALDAQLLSGADDLCSLSFCAEHCIRTVEELAPEQCNASVFFPAPACERTSTTPAGDIYYFIARRRGQDAETEAWQKRTKWRVLMRTNLTAQLVFRRAAVLHPECDVSTTLVQSPPMMYPEEVELLVKTLIRLRPRNYLEWGAGKSTAWYPLLASRSYVIDNYAPWCERVRQMPTVQCLHARQRLSFQCATTTFANGSSVPVGPLGMPTSKKTSKLVLSRYLEAFESIVASGITFDAALIDGRFRVAATLKLLNHVHADSVIFIHDFWLRLRNYNVVLRYYDVIGRARSAVVLKRKTPSLLPDGWQEAHRRHTNAI